MPDHNTQPDYSALASELHKLAAAIAGAQHDLAKSVATDLLPALGTLYADATVDIQKSPDGRLVASRGVSLTDKESRRKDLLTAARRVMDSAWKGQTRPADALTIRALAEHLGGAPAAESAPPAAPAATQAVNDDSHLSPAGLAKVFGLPADSLRKRLDTWRRSNGQGWVENQEHGPREPKYLYSVAAVRGVLGKLAADAKTSGERPAK